LLMGGNWIFLFPPFIRGKGGKNVIKIRDTTFKTSSNSLE
jgi:hypothetical protein